MGCIIGLLKLPFMAIGLLFMVIGDLAKRAGGRR